MHPILDDWKRDPFVGIVGAVSAVGAVVMVPYLWLRKGRFVVASPDEFVWDFSYFYRAAERFAADPLTLYGDVEYFYPPPSVLAFLPWLAFPEHVAYLVAVVVNVVLMAVCSVLAVRLWERRAGPMSAGARAAAILFALSSAPTFQTLKYAQVGPLVLLSVLAMLWWIERRPAGAALALAAGFWLKLYPLALAPLGLLRAGRTRFAAGLAVGLVAVPLVLLPFVPASLYPDYVQNRLPAMSSQTLTYALNQSLPSALERALRPGDAALNNRSPATVRPAVKIATAVVGAGLLGAVVGLFAMGRLSQVSAAFLTLSLLPFVSNFGWEHAYVLALPLTQAAFLIAAGSARRSWRVLAGLAVGCLLFPMLPNVVLRALVDLDLRPLSDLLLVRFPVVLLLAAFVVGAWERHARERPTTRAPAA